jgi:hypothetical protein
MTKACLVRPVTELVLNEGDQVLQGGETTVVLEGGSGSKSFREDRRLDKGGLKNTRVRVHPAIQ